jgi:LacI family transcriptional regulator
VPDDIAILGVDNDESICDISYPPLSSIRLGAEQIGHRAVALMEQMLLGKTLAEQRAWVPPIGVVTRQSTDVLAVDDPDVAALLALIRRHATEGVTVKQVMRSIAVNRRTLERRFIAAVGATPLDEIRRVRIERAKALLQSNIPIYEVARRSGFHTPEYLATAFSRLTGLSPTAYRKRFAAAPYAAVT